MAKFHVRTSDSTTVVIAERVHFLGHGGVAFFEGEASKVTRKGSVTLGRLVHAFSSFEEVVREIV